MDETPPVKQQQKMMKNLTQKVGVKEARKLRARLREGPSVWFGLGTFGIIGWSVSIPTLIGVAIGVWIDTTWPTEHVWTLTFLFVGAVIGSLNAWFWVKKERKRILNDQGGPLNG